MSFYVEMANLTEGWGSKHVSPLLLEQGPSVASQKGLPVPTPSRTRQLIIYHPSGSDGELFQSNCASAAAKYQALRHGSAVGLHVVHLDEAFISCLLWTSRGHILDTLCWTMKTIRLPGSLTVWDYLPLQCSLFFPLAWRGFISWASSLCSRHLIKGKWASSDTLMSLLWP